MSWTLSTALQTLRGQINILFPKRSKLSDGSIGDLAHANRKSDHNPNAQKVVCAVDITHDVANGLDCERLAKVLLESKDSRIKYIIWNRRITNKNKDGWLLYSGANSHSKHLHISVNSRFDEGSYWNLKGL